MELKVNNLVLKYGQHTVLKELNLEMKGGLIYGLVGVNGSGKTSLLNCMCGLQPFSKGEVLLNGNSLQTSSTGYLETSVFAYPLMTGRDYLGFFAQSNNSFSLQKWNALFDHPLDEYISNYSTGMQKKLGLMGIIALDRNVVLLDEPFNALDIETVELLKQILPELSKRNKILLITSHILETLTDTCDYIFYLNKGQVNKTYPRSEFPDLAEALKTHFRERFHQGIQSAFEK